MVLPSQLRWHAVSLKMQTHVLPMLTVRGTRLKHAKRTHPLLQARRLVHLHVSWMTTMTKASQNDSLHSRTTAPLRCKLLPRWILKTVKCTCLVLCRMVLPRLVRSLPPPLQCQRGHMQRQVQECKDVNSIGWVGSSRHGNTNVVGIVDRRT
jgi:hypothetical protein